jgi:aspartate/methionine/tyrosine aminotransferase
MDNADMLMVRTHDDPSVFNLAVGEPFFLHEHLSFLEATATGGPYLYPQSRGEPELLKELERRHHGMHCVVTTGAKQGISAALAAYAEVYGKLSVKHEPPYWPSMPILALREGLDFLPHPQWSFKELPLLRGGVALVSSEDFGWASQETWRVGGNGYIVNSHHEHLHRLVLRAFPDVVVDHVNGDRMDNRRANLRVCSNQDNIRNQKKTRGSSRFKGVSWSVQNKKWYAYIKVSGKSMSLGHFDVEEDAARAYDAAAREAFGRFAQLNNKQAQTISLATLINNPDGRVCTEAVDILDCAYAHQVYGWDGAPIPSHGVAVYSAAKLLGLSGLRIGWVVTADAKLAKAMATYVERYTSGVCVTSQRHLAYALRHLRVNDDHAFFDAARKTLLRNGDNFMKLLGDRLSRVEGVPTSGKGMFSWFHIPSESLQGFREALATSRVLLMPGEAFGMREPGWYRMSMGHHDGYTYRALKVLAEAWA